MIRALGLSLMLALALAGCAWERTNRLGPIDPWPPRRGGEPPRSLALRIYGTSRFEGTPADIPPAELAVWRDAALRAYTESNLFSRVAATWEPADIVAEISIIKSAAPMKGIQLLFGQKQYRQTDIEMRTRFRLPDGTLLRLVDLSEAIRTIAFFTQPRQESVESLSAILYDLNRATLNQASRAGVLRLEPAGEAEAEEKS